MDAKNPTEPDLISSISTETDDAPAIRERQGQSMGAPETIAPGMEVIAADGGRLGVVEAVEAGEIRLARDDTAQDGDGGDVDHRLLPLSLVDVVAGGRVIMRARGGDAFGMAG